jgi:sugar porter (SP) family MFS transporter
LPSETTRRAGIFVLGGGLCAAVAFLKDAAPQRALAFGLLMAARCCFGAGAGAASVAVPMYLGEIAPASLKGAFGALNQFSLVVLILLGQFMSLGMSGSALWPWLFASQGVLAAAVILASGPLLLESPRWLVAQGRADEARAVLLSCRGYSEADAEAEVDEIRAGGAAQGGGDGKGAEPMTTMQLLAAPALRAPLLVAVMLQLTQQFSGINAVFFYSTSFFEAAVADPGAAAGAAPSAQSQLVATWGTIATGAINVLATAASIPLIERAGRKPLLLWACGGMLACSLCLTGVLVVKDAAPAFAKLFGSLSIVFVLVYVCFFEIGLGAIPWSIGGELFPESSRATAMGFAAGANWLGTTIVGVAFPYLQELLGNYSFLPFAVWLAIGLTFTIVYVPETKGRTPAELLAWFAERGGSAKGGGNYALLGKAAAEDEES